MPACCFPLILSVLCMPWKKKNKHLSWSKLATSLPSSPLRSSCYSLFSSSRPPLHPLDLTQWSLQTLAMHFASCQGQWNNQQDTVHILVSYLWARDIHSYQRERSFSLKKTHCPSQIFYTKLWMMPFSETAWKLCQLARILTASSLISQERDMLHETLYNLQQNTNYQEFEAILNQFHFKLWSCKSKLSQKKRKELDKLIHQHEWTHPAPNIPLRTKRKTCRFRRRAVVVDDCVVVNLSIVRLMTDQLDLLALSPKYSPTPCSLDCQRLLQDITEECHRIRLKELYHVPP